MGWTPYLCALSSSENTPSMAWVYALVELSAWLYSSCEIPFMYILAGAIPPVVASIGILFPKSSLGHLLWNYCGPCRPWLTVSAAFAWIPLVFLLWPGVQFWSHCIFIAFWIVSCWRTKLACDSELSKLPIALWRHLCKSWWAFKSLDRPGLLFYDNSLNVVWWIRSHRHGFFLVLFFLVVFILPHSPTRSVRETSISLSFAHMS